MLGLGKMARARMNDHGIHYEDRLVAFLDILGWRNAVARSQHDPALAASLGNALSVPRAQCRYLDWLREEGLDEQFAGSPQIALFSDSICISTQIDVGGRRAMSFFLRTLCEGLFRNALLIRGAVTRGLIYHKDNVVYGPALVEAYDLERRVAFYPRIVLSREAMVFRTTAGWRKDTDGVWFFDFLTWLGEREPRPVIEKLEHGLSATVSDLRSHQKWQWASRQAATCSYQVRTISCQFGAVRNYLSRSAARGRRYRTGLIARRPSP